MTGHPVAPPTPSLATIFQETRHSKILGANVTTEIYRDQIDAAQELTEDLKRKGLVPETVVYDRDPDDEYKTIPMTLPGAGRRAKGLTDEQRAKIMTIEPDRKTAEDPWANLSTYACSTCRFFVPKPETNTADRGRCRRHAPTMDGYPVVYAKDWCGDHKLGTNPSRS